MTTVNESLTVLIERNTEFASEFATEPYEVAWAREARWFVVLDEPPNGVEFRLETEISPDGLDWCPLEDVQPHVAGSRVTSWSVRDFGGWLRVRGSVAGQGQVKGSIFLALKA
ncbi:hypothetical protein [Ruania zhangjianzhongii]|uniref:hypothetical protein n=1 Tax=Ruania zhangjianzhongii TaxID=2603206 RepID=UPI001AEFC11B|nr:hypothetical protein [Ruania zhangjianzhongii]